MRVNMVVMEGDVVEVQLPEGDTLISGGPEIASLFNRFTPVGPMSDDNGWAVTPYNVDPWSAPGVLGSALQREAALSGCAHGCG